MMIFIYQNILVGILFLMKLFTTKMKLLKKRGIKLAEASGSQVEWIEEESYFFRLSKWQDKLARLL